MGGAGGGAGALIPEGPGASEEGRRCVPEREERDRNVSLLPRCPFMKFYRRVFT